MKTLWEMWKSIPLQFQISLVLLFVLLAVAGCDTPDPMHWLRFCMAENCV
jgi:hypothetical protein